MKENEVSSLFNRWSEQGMDRQMERGHGYAVERMLTEIKLERPFDFLDVGCGNGWAVRKVSRNKFCSSAWGIDVSDTMVNHANELKSSDKQHFLNMDLLEWQTEKRFDVIFSMEALYYIIPLEAALKKIYILLKDGGLFLCGVDYYTENKASHEWAEKCGLTMELRTSQQWLEAFRKIGFKDVNQSNITYPAEITDEVWKQEFGTLFTRGKK